MKIIFAQGNPGQQYQQTRHNIGWLIIDALASQTNAQFTAKPKFYAAIADIKLHSERILLVKPTTFYNQTGQSARALIDFYKLTNNDILVLHDDLAIDFGKLRIRQQGRDAGNNGIKSLNAHLGTNFARLRLGIYSPLRDKIHDADFVLKCFTNDELNQINNKIAPAALALIDDFISGKLEPTSTDALKDS